jgi:hypothetical protein
MVAEGGDKGMLFEVFPNLRYSHCWVVNSCPALPIVEVVILSEIMSVVVVVVAVVAVVAE